MSNDIRFKLLSILLLLPLLAPAQGEDNARLRQSWSDLSATNFATANRAYQVLLSAGDDAVPFLKQHILQVAVPPVDHQRLHDLVAKLDDKDFAARQHAAEELVKYGELAVRPLQKLIEKNTTLEASQRARKLIDTLKAVAITPERLCAFEGIGILEAIGTPAARRALADVHREALVPLLRNEAARALRRVEKTK